MSANGQYLEGLTTLPASTLFILLAFALLVAFFALVGWAWQAWRLRELTRAPGLALQERAQHAARGEELAKRLLERQGFRVQAEQMTGGYTMCVNGVDVKVKLRADLIAEREGKRWLVEVKTGQDAVRYDYAPTRRQLLEYAVAYPVDGVLLLDADRARMVQVEFPMIAGIAAVPPVSGKLG